MQGAGKVTPPAGRPFPPSRHRSEAERPASVWPSDTLPRNTGAAAGA